MILKLDFASEVPIYQQIRNQIVLGVADGQLKPGERLPTIRALADEAGVNTMTVNKAYALLKSEGIIVADRRSGARVRERESVPGVSGSSTDQGKKAELKGRTVQELKLVIAEAKLTGMGKSDFLDLCAELFEDKKSLQEG
ncbi:MAG: GntR family transcriptional regulator [Lachnospiraceae bacterium]|nr:GntR family transcriptional regulator [Lachnospiraceae bacterium]